MDLMNTEILNNARKEHVNKISMYSFLLEFLKSPLLIFNSDYWNGTYWRKNAIRIHLNYLKELNIGAVSETKELPRATVIEELVYYRILMTENEFKEFLKLTKIDANTDELQKNMFSKMNQSMANQSITTPQYDNNITISINKLKNDLNELNIFMATKEKIKQLQSQLDNIPHKNLNQDQSRQVEIFQLQIHVLTFGRIITAKLPTDFDPEDNQLNGNLIETYFIYLNDWIKQDFDAFVEDLEYEKQESKGIEGLYNQLVNEFFQLAEPSKCNDELLLNSETEETIKKEIIGKVQNLIQLFKKNNHPKYMALLQNILDVMNKNDHSVKNNSLFSNIKNRNESPVSVIQFNIK
ncbi:MAG: hypothetical protein CMF41_00960 [Legionellales bacterium]|nr:hypothetical protein [Legionellales bacterium]|tara:strand:+ start:696 stop:1751 length:1056 start_codon:yes stop_codon:yes gene_type:complete